MTVTIEKYIEDNEDSIDWYDDSSHKVGEKELHQIEVLSVRPYENADGTVGFDVIVTADIVERAKAEKISTTRNNANAPKYEKYKF